VLVASFYGLKQAPRAWNTRLSDFLLSVGFHASKVDTTSFILSVGVNIFYLLVYVDDILLTSSNSTVLHRLIQLLSSEFKLRDLGVAHYFLGIGVHSTAMGLMLRQHKYILDILTRAGMTFYKPVDTPISTSKVTIMSDPLFPNPTLFCEIVGALQYLTLLDWISALRLTEFVSLCMLLQTLIGVSLNTFCVIYGVQLPMTYISLAVPHLIYMALQMLIGKVVLMIENPYVVILSSLVRHRFHEN
jgi:hypothetical protein